MRRAALRILPRAQEGFQDALGRVDRENTYQNIQHRDIRIFEIFNKEKARERQKKLKEEASQGYWDDFKELKDSKGKLFSATDSLISAQKAPLLPDVKVLTPDGADTSLQDQAGAATATLLCVAFRSGAEDMLASWSKRFGEQNQGLDSQHIELSLVESTVMSLWPFKSMILKGRSVDAEAASIKPKYLFHFGDATPFIETLNLSNRLTGYVFLIDRQARVRWHASGRASQEEAKYLLRCSEELLKESNAYPLKNP